jgi:aminoglycoside 2'-N-acetyltransferase I
MAGVQRVRAFTDGETPRAVLPALRRLVFDAFDGRFSQEDWEHTTGGWRIVLFDEDTPVAHAAVVPRVLRVGQREFRAGYVEGVATRKGHQQRGYGSTVMTRVTSLVRSRFELGGLSTGRRDFYARFGWEPWRGPSYVHDGEELIRTPDEDDGLMVLRFGSSSGVDLDAPIACQSRPGDDW